MGAYGGKLVIVREHQKQSTIEVLNAKTGEPMWKKNRAEGNNWATPAIVQHGGKTQVITTASGKVRSYDLANGDLIWQCAGLTGNVIPCPVVENGVVQLLPSARFFFQMGSPVLALSTSMVDCF